MNSAGFHRPETRVFWLKVSQNGLNIEPGPKLKFWESLYRMEIVQE
jgi:hypothetical protein